MLLCQLNTASELSAQVSMAERLKGSKVVGKTRKAKGSFFGSDLKVSFMLKPDGTVEVLEEDSGHMALQADIVSQKIEKTWKVTDEDKLEIAIREKTSAKNDMFAPVKIITYEIKKDRIHLIDLPLQNDLDKFRARGTETYKSETIDTIGDAPRKNGFSNEYMTTYEIVFKDGGHNIDSENLWQNVLSEYESDRTAQEDREERERAEGEKNSKLDGKVKIEKSDTAVANGDENTSKGDSPARDWKSEFEKAKEFGDKRIELTKDTVERIGTAKEVGEEIEAIRGALELGKAGRIPLAKGILDLAKLKISPEAALAWGYSDYLDKGTKIVDEQLGKLGDDLSSTQSRVEQEVANLNGQKLRSAGAKAAQDQLTPDQMASRLEQRVEKIRKEQGPEAAAKAEKEILQQLQEVGKGLKRLDDILSKAAAAK